MFRTHSICRTPIRSHTFHSPGLRSGVALVALSFAAPAGAAAQVPDAERPAIVWDLTDLYATDAAWEAKRAELAEAIDRLPRLKGTLGNSSAALADALTEISAANKEMSRLFAYANLKYDEDQRKPQSQDRYQKARNLGADLGEAVSWLSPEILRLGTEKVEAYLAAEPRLKPFDFLLRDVLRGAPHTLDDAGESLMASARIVLSSPNEIYSLLANTDIPWPSLTLSGGKQVKLNQAGYSQYRQVPNREDRKKVFDSFWGAWEGYANTMGAILSTEIQSNVFQAKARNYKTVLEANLFADGLPPEIYTNLVDQVNAALPAFHRYLKLRGRILGIDQMRYYDIYPPLVALEGGDFTMARSREITFESLKPFGPDYLNLLAEGLEGQWMHAYPQDGKESGAYMNGSAYDVHPYVLLNHTDDYDSLSTYTHEWGHAVHTLLANRAQPYEKASYSTFIAEMASTINEILLQEYVIAQADTKEEKLFYLGHALESVRGTLFRQTMFAEFELAIHQEVEAGNPLSGTRLTEIYTELLKRYHGHDQDVLLIDEPYGMEWAYIPHFYYDFYVFQYATSISGAAWFAEQFLAGDDAVREAFIEVLKAGGNGYPHDILKEKAGLDMTRPEAYAPVVRRMNDLMDRIEALLDK